MAEVGESIENAATGERITFVATRATTGGALLEFDLTLAAGGRLGGAPHRHPVAERFEVRSGTLSARLRRHRRDVGPGEVLEIPPGVGHYLWNDGAEDVRARVQIRPGLDLETFFETVFELGTRRRYRSFRGLPAPLHGALLTATYEVYGPLLPLGLQRTLARPLAALARRRGYKAALAPERALVRTGR